MNRPGEEIEPTKEGKSLTIWKDPFSFVFNRSLLSFFKGKFEWENDMYNVQFLLTCLPYHLHGECVIIVVYTGLILHFRAQTKELIAPQIKNQCNLRCAPGYFVLFTHQDFIVPLVESFHHNQGKIRGSFFYPQGFCLNKDFLSQCVLLNQILFLVCKSD